MELYIDRDALKSALARVQEVIEKRSTVPVLSHVLLHARDGALHLTATDQESAYRGEMPANVTKGGELAVDASSLWSAVRELPEATVHLTQTDRLQLEVRSGRAHFRLHALAAEEYPALAPFAPVSQVKVQAPELRRLVEQVSGSVATEDVRWGLNGAHLERRDEGDAPKLRMVATDGHRLAAAEAAFEGTLTLAPRQLVPRKALKVLKNVLGMRKDEVALTFGDGAFQLELGTEVFWFRMIEAEFPDYQAVVPSSHKHRATLRKADLVSTLRRVNVLASDRARPVRFRFDEAELEVHTRNVDRGELRETLPIELEGPGITVGFNPRYLLDVLEVVTGEHLVLELAHPLAPCLLRNPDAPQAFFVIMPMRLD
jgi:DNA polymerase-3 subunit beta